MQNGRMTRNKAIDILKCGRPFDDNPKDDLDKFNLALGVAIKALKNENALLDRVLESIDKTKNLCYIKGFTKRDEELYLSAIEGYAVTLRREILALKEEARNEKRRENQRETR